MSVKFSREFYGWDRFSKVTLIVGLCLLLNKYTWIWAITLIIYSLWRSKSRNVNRRIKEEVAFENFENYFWNKINKFKFKFNKVNRLKRNKILGSIRLNPFNAINKLKEKRKYIIISCPKCSQKLRLPRGKGKIIVTCAKCGCEIRLRT